MNPDIPGYEEFEFNLPDALLVALVKVLDAMDRAVLSEQNTREIPEEQGVYQLFHEGKLVYIGKTDSEAGLQHRLTRHVKRLLHRPRLDATKVEFKAVRIMVFTAMDLETSLIKHYGIKIPKSRKRKVPWNDSGFGSNDPGRNREDTEKPRKGYDGQFPVSIDIPGVFIPEGTMLVSEAVKTLKDNLPYCFRYQTVENPNARGKAHHFHSDLKACRVTIPSEQLTARELLLHIIAALPDGWRATYFVSHVILYKEMRDYKYGVIIKPLDNSASGRIDTSITLPMQGAT